MMKLRNKKTGEIATLDSEHTDSLADFGGKLLIEVGSKEFYYDTLAELNEDWEDYKPIKPLIKDEKVRKAVRAWAEINGIETVLVCETFNAWGVKNIAKGEPGDKEYMLADILFRGEKPEELEFGKEYSIIELCGEEE